LFLALTAGFGNAAEFWTDRKAADWTPAEKERLLTNSPWAKTVTAGLDPTKGTGLRIGGFVLGPSGAGAPTGIPKLQAVIRWASAAPVREALGKPLPEEAAGKLVLSVTVTGTLTLQGDGPGAEEELLSGTSLMEKGKIPVNPSLIMRSERDATIFFLFPANAAQASAKEWEFETSLGSFVLKTKFAPRDMKYLGKPAI